MDTETVSLFFALLAVVAELATALAIVLAIGGRFSSAVAAFRVRVVGTVAPAALSLAFLVAATCMTGSLYYSEVAHFPPCHLCWLQRFCMYPLVPLLGYGAWKREGRIRPLAVALATIGAVIATYHVLLERNPQWESSACDPKNPCTLIWVERLGYLTIPTMALSGFLLIITLLVVSRAGGRLRLSDDPRSEIHGHT